MEEESLELEYALENGEFRMPPLDLMILVLERDTYQGMYGSPLPDREEDSYILRLFSSLPLSSVLEW